MSQIIEENKPDGLNVVVPDVAARIDAIRPLLADAFGSDSTHVQNLNKQLDRLGPSEAHG